MTKNQRKGNREAKKPRQEKSTPATTPGTPWTTLEKIKAQGSRTQDRGRK